MNSKEKKCLYSESLGQFVESVGNDKDGKKKVSFVVDWTTVPIDFTWYSAFYWKWWIKIYFGEKVVRKNFVVFGDNPTTLDEVEE